VSGGEVARDDRDIFGVRSGISSVLASGSFGEKAVSVAYGTVY
jgi:hypothetical protein